ncbi:MAG: hypothetical protein ACLGGX_08495 [Bdellovibrionia bacterium]
MKNNLRALIAVSMSLIGAKVKAEVRAIDLNVAETLTRRYSSETLGRISQRGVIFLIDNDEKVYLHATRAKQILADQTLIEQDPSTVDLLKDMLKGSVKVDQKSIKDIVLSTQDYQVKKIEK